MSLQGMIDKSIRPGDLITSRCKTSTVEKGTVGLIIEIYEKTIFDDGEKVVKVLWSNNRPPDLTLLSDCQRANV